MNYRDAKTKKKQTRSSGENIIVSSEKYKWLFYYAKARIPDKLCLR